MRREVGTLLRYGLVGLGVNLALYLLYLGLTALGWPPHGAMTFAYALGLALAFVLHRRFSFRSDVAPTRAVMPFLATHAVGYGVNALGLWWLIERAQLAHQAAQAIMVLVVAAVVFVIQRWWVFPAAAHGPGSGGD